MRLTTLTGKGSGLRIWPLVFFAVILTQGCHQKAEPDDPNADKWVLKLNELMPSSIVDFFKSQDHDKSMPYPVIFKNEEGQAIDSAKIRVCFNADTASLYTNQSGIVKLTVSKPVIEKNPTLVIEKEGFKAGDFDYKLGAQTVTFKDSEGDFTFINYNNLEHQKVLRTKIYYDEKAVFLQNSDKIKSIIRFLHDSAGFKNPQPVHLLLTKAPNVISMGSNKKKEKETVLPINVNNWKELYWAYTHEFVEVNLMTANKHKLIYDFNSNLRWIGDGLAEFYALKVLRKKNKKYAKKMLNTRIEALKKYNDTAFNLFSWKAGAANTNDHGYAFSLAFWVANYDKNRASLFVKRFQNLNNYKNEQIIKLIKETLGYKGDYSLNTKRARKILIKSHLYKKVEGGS